MKKIALIALLTTIILNSCELIGLDEKTTPGNGNYGVLTLSQRSDLVPTGWLPEGEMVFKGKNHYSNNSKTIELGLSENPDNKVTIVVGLGRDYSCVAPGSFCVVNSSTGHPAISLTIMESLGSIGQYRASSGTVHYENLDPLIVRFEKVYMVPENYSGNKATGSFYFDGELFAESN